MNLGHSFLSISSSQCAHGLGIPPSSDVPGKTFASRWKSVPILGVFKPKPVAQTGPGWWH